MRVVSLFSGGKDSTFALWCAQMQGWDVEALITVIPKSPESWMFHYPATQWTRLQAEAMALPQIRVESEGVKENELDDLTKALRSFMNTVPVEGLVSGAVSSEYQKTRLDGICEDLELRSFMPLWHKNPEELVKEQLDAGFEVLITACSAMGLDEKWLGKKLNYSDLMRLIELKNRVGLNVAFEGGEAETFVLWAPMFRRTLRVTEAVQEWHGESGVLKITNMEFKPI